MVVCKFFQQGSCRYGQNCRFEHIYGSKYSYHANPPPQNQQTPAETVVTDEQLVNQVQSNIQAALKGGQWIFSSYAPFKEKPGYPGLTDLSPEETRLFMYEAKANNTVDQAVFYMDKLYKETRSKYEQLLHPTMNTIKILRSLFRGETEAQPAVTQTAFGATNASSIFRSALNSAPVPQGNTTSIFNQGSNQNIFGQKAQDSAAAKSIFAQANQTSFGFPAATPSVFQTNTTGTPKSIFAQQNQKVFGGTPAATNNSPSSIFASASQSIFGKANETTGQSIFAPTPNVFQKPSQPDSGQKSVFGAPSNIFQQNSSDSDDVYSKLEDLSQDDIEAYKSSDFKLGFVPESPPPLALCS